MNSYFKLQYLIIIDVKRFEAIILTLPQLFKKEDNLIQKIPPKYTLINLSRVFGCY